MPASHLPRRPPRRHCPGTPPAGTTRTSARAAHRRDRPRIRGRPPSIARPWRGPSRPPRSACGTGRTRGRTSPPAPGAGPRPRSRARGWPKSDARAASCPSRRPRAGPGPVPVRNGRRRTGSGSSSPRRRQGRSTRQAKVLSIRRAAWIPESELSSPPPPPDAWRSLTRPRRSRAAVPQSKMQRVSRLCSRSRLPCRAPAVRSLLRGIFWR
mmetsp:Transcript_19540/g.45850  ORF Transcript_19540/g.45850 Transcript_19540/m.45850 type:complete len:211 (+) Transcript_19540:562-1194(+)